MTMSGLDVLGTFLFALSAFGTGRCLLLGGKKRVVDHETCGIVEDDLVVIQGEVRGDIECKLAESLMGTCSQPGLPKQNPCYCDGTYTYQKSRSERCSLTEIGVSYWQHIPKLFKWSNHTDHKLCPVYKNYQLIRNILAACVCSDGSISEGKGRAILIYDERNPSFQEGGAGLAAFEETKSALLETGMLKIFSWQFIINHIKEKRALGWLTEQLEAKYGF